MADQFGFSEGVKTLTGSMDSARESAKSLSKQVEAIQKDGLDVAQQKAQERLRTRREAEVKKRLAIHKALAEYKHRKLISHEEYSLKVEFLRQFKNTAMGEKEWAEILKIKRELEELEKKEKAEFDGDLKNIRRAQFMCFLVAAWIAYIIVWGDK
jgi:magnesium-transporting ATPase (P-type)